MPAPVQTPELLLECEAINICQHWRGLKQPVSVSLEVAGVRCEITLRPGTAIPVVHVDAPTDCERHIVEILKAAGRRLKQAEVIFDLAKVGHSYGDSTVIHSLARMTRDGRLHNVPRRGYAIVELK